MMIDKLGTWLALAWALGLAAVPAQAQQQTRVLQEVVAFGDSNIDNGNTMAWNLSQGRAPFPVAPYTWGRHSNGPLYVERIASGLGLSISADGDGGTNYAIGGAVTTAEENWGALGQVETYLWRTGNRANPQALYVIQSGDNDVEAAISVYTSTGSLAAAQALLEERLGTMSVLLNRLHSVGARHFLVGNVFDLGRAPNWSGTPYRSTIRYLAQRWNAGLKTRLDALSAKPGVQQVVQLDAWGTMEWAFQASNGTFPRRAEACLNGWTVCANPNLHVFWDGIHMTTRYHTKLATQALAALRK